MTSTVVIVNPASSGGATGRNWDVLQAKLEAALGSFEARHTDAPGNATLLARQALEAGAERIIAVGGDGTVGEVVNGFYDQDTLINPDAVLGLIDAGTGSDFRRNLGFDASQDAQIAALQHGHTRLMTIGRANYHTSEGKLTSRYFTVLCGFGISTAINHYVNSSPRLKRYGAAAAFTIASLHLIFTFKNPAVRIQVDDQPLLEGPSLLSATCNGRWIGGGMSMAPDGDMFAPELDFLIGGDIRLVNRLRLFSGVYKGSHIGRPKVHAFKGQTLTASVISGGDVLVDMDGDIVGKLPLTIEAQPQAIRVIFPQ